MQCPLPTHLSYLMSTILTFHIHIHAPHPSIRPITTAQTPCNVHARLHPVWGSSQRIYGIPHMHIYIGIYTSLGGKGGERGTGLGSLPLSPFSYKTAAEPTYLVRSEPATLQRCAAAAMRCAATPSRRDVGCYVVRVATCKNGLRVGLARLGFLGLLPSSLLPLPPLLISYYRIGAYVSCVLWCSGVADTESVGS